jgi:hypothetical protein
VITRIWRGWTTPENADAYQRIVSQEVLPSIAARKLDGYHGAYLLRRDLGGEVEFATIMLFDSLEQVRGFAGEDYESAYVPPKARAVLTRFDQRSAHYDTLQRPHTSDRRRRMMEAEATDLPKLSALRDGRYLVPATPTLSTSPRSGSPRSCGCTAWTQGDAGAP